jgi:gluconolactonase
MPPGGRRIQAAKGIENPNGVTVSRDERTLYINNTRGEYLLTYEVQADGRLTNGRNFGKYAGVTESDAGFARGADGPAIHNDGGFIARAA